MDGEHTKYIYYPENDFFFSFMLNSLWFCSYSELAEAICTDKGRTVTPLCALVITVYKTRILSMVFY